MEYHRSVAQSFLINTPIDGTTLPIAIYPRNHYALDMKREWRIGRIILAMLLLTVIGVAFYVWPKGPRWRIEREQPVGFDLKRGLLFAIDTSRKPEEWELHGIDLETGKRQVTLPITFSDVHPINDPFWRFCFSADCSKLLGVDIIRGQYDIIDLENQGRRLPHSYHGGIDNIGMSANGELVGTRINEHVQILETRTGKLKRQLEMPKESMFFGFGRKGHAAFPDQLKFSNDRRYLAVSSDQESVIVFDLSTGRQIGECQGATHPLFLPDNKTLLTFSNHLLTKDGEGMIIKWFKLEGDQIRPMPQVVMFSQEWVLVADAANVISFRVHRPGDSGFKLPDWLPRSLQNKLNDLINLIDSKVIIRAIDSSTGQTQCEFGIRVQDLGRFTTKVSPDGMVLASQGVEHLALWDLPPRRSLTCWLVSSSLAAFALWLAWPRRRRVSPMAA